MEHMVKFSFLLLVMSSLCGPSFGRMFGFGFRPELESGSWNAVRSRTELEPREPKASLEGQADEKEAGGDLSLSGGWKIVDDMILPADFGEPTAFGVRSGLRDEKFRWKNATLVYNITDDFSPQEVALIYEGMAKISKVTCVTFREKKGTDEDFVEITKERAGPSGCVSFVGRKSGIQKLYLPYSWCVTPGVIAHELVHSLGFHHEHERPDRDDFVVINWSNIQPDAKFAFRKLDNETATTFGVVYNYSSLMHYPNDASAIDDSIPTIYRKDWPEFPLGQLEDLTELDAEKIRRMYNCTRDSP